MTTRILILLLACQVSQAQRLSGESLFARERSIDRRIIVHGNQLRVTGGYGLSVVSRRYDDVGNVFTLRDEGSSSLRHRFDLDVKYGINDFVQVTVGMAASQQLVRGQTEYIFPQEDDPVISHQVINEYSGLEDLFVGLDVRAPFPTRRLDVAIALGAYLPVSRWEAPPPSHSFQTATYNGAPMHSFVYRYFNPQGAGITVGQIGGMVKYRTKRMAFSGRLDYQHGLSDATRLEWRHQFDPTNGFEYRKTPYTYRLPDSFLYFVELEYQPRRWLDLFINFSGYTAQRGWVSYNGDLKVALPFQTIGVCSPGVEILLTPRLWVRERVDIAVAGLNVEGATGFHTSIMYNLFPFRQGGI